MESIEFLVQGSAPKPYEVSFSKEGNNLTAHCTCPAGQVGQYCKHRFRILEGKTQGIVSGNESEAQIIKSWLVGTDVESAMIEVKKAESRLEEAKKELSGYKKKLAHSLMD